MLPTLQFLASLDGDTGFGLVLAFVIISIMVANLIATTTAGAAQMIAAARGKQPTSTNDAE